MSTMYPIEIAKLQCVGERHVVALMHTKKKRGRQKVSLCVLNHGEKSKHPLSSVRAMRLISPEFRCRCLEVLHAWEVYTSWPMERVESLVYLEDDVSHSLKFSLQRAIDKKQRATGVSLSNILSLIPECLRSFAKEAREKGDERRENKFQGRTFVLSPDAKHHPRWMNHILSAPAHRTCWSVGSLLNTEERFRVYHSKTGIQNPWFRERLAQCNLTGDPYYSAEHRPIEDFIKGRTLNTRGTWIPKANAWLRLYWDNQWVRELLREGYAPRRVPPKDMWERNGNGNLSHPALLIVCKWKGRPDINQYRSFYMKVRLRVDVPSRRPMQPNKYLFPDFQETSSGDFRFEISDQVDDS